MEKPWKRKGILIFSLLTAMFAFYTGAFGALVPPVQNGVHILLIFPILFLSKGSKIFSGKTEDFVNVLMVLMNLACFGWYVLNWERLYIDPNLKPTDFVMGTIGMLLVLEATRRTAGLSITILILLFVIYAIIGRSIPFKFIAHQGYTLQQIVYLVFYGTEGVFGTPISVCATFIVLIVIFGGFLTASGAADFFMNLAKSLAGSAKGGPAKIAVVASGFMGMITGATVANVATTGSVTIPMMKKMGLKGYYAGAVEALASSGSQLAPPIMGAAVFIMVDFTMVPYLKICMAAIIPALLYFFSVFMIVHFHAVKEGMEGIPKEDCPNFWEEMRSGGFLLIPIIVLVYLLSRWMDPMFAVFLSIVSLLIVSWFTKRTRIDFSRFMEGVVKGVNAMAPLTAICAAAGILVGILSMTGLGMRIAFLIEMFSYGHLLLTLILTASACIVLGMGLPTVAAYVVLATIVPPVLKKFGVDILPAHMFIFYFAIISAFTPPVCTGAYCAAGIADSDPLKTGFTAVRLGLVAFILPFVFIYDPAILMMGSFYKTSIVFLFTTIGILFWAGALEGHFFWGKLNGVQRTLIGVSALMLMFPKNYIRLLGLLITGIVCLMMFYSNKNKKEAIATIHTSE
ncbi:MAG: TRAP transporter permease [Desulfobacterium sp.]|nr:TRAP transporter permease [Desulfobacterium sp.]